MGVLRSVSGLQMYQRAVRGPIEGPSVVRFLLEHDRFPRAVRALLREIRRALAELPDPGGPLDAVDHVEAVLRDSTAASTDGAGARRRDGRTCRSPSASSTGGSPIATCGSAPDVTARRRRPRSGDGAAELLAAVPDRPPRADPPPGRGRPGDRRRRSPATSSTSSPTPTAADARSSRPWRLDPVPLVLDGATFRPARRRRRPARARRWRRCSPTSTGRARPCATASCPAEALSSSPRYRLAAVGAPPPPRWLTTLRRRRRRASPTGRGASSRTSPTRRPASGTRCIDRSVMARVAAELLGPDGSTGPGLDQRLPGRAAPTPWPRLTTGSPARGSCCSRGGLDDPAYVEHSSLARLLGFHLVEAPDLVVRQGRLWLRTLGGLDPIDVVYRRLADDVVDPIEVEHDQRGPACRGCCSPRRGRRGAGQRPRLGRARGSRRWRRSGRPRWRS